MTSTHRSARPATDPLRHPEGSPAEVRSRRAYWLVLMTLVVPGSAQVVAGNRRLGRLGLRTFVGVLLAVALGVVALRLDRSLVLSLLTRTVTLWVLLGVLVALAALWAVLFVDAWRLARPGRLPSTSARVVTGLTMLLVVATSGSLLYGGYLVSAQRSLISTVFGGGVSADPVDGRYNIVLIGGDAGADRVGLRNDSTNLISIDARTGAAVQIGIPRNLANVPFPADSPLAPVFPDGFHVGDDVFFNGLYTYGSEHPELFPDAKDPGAEAVKEGVEGVTGLEVQYYALIDMGGFEQLVDAMGGIEVDVRKRVPKAAVTARRADEFIEVGRQRLGGADALWFARSRFESSDYERMARQRCVMSAMVAQVDPQTLLLRFQDIASAGAGVVSTDLPQADLGGFVDLALKTKSQPITSVQLVPPVVDTGNPDYDHIHQMVAEAVAASEAAQQDGASGAESPAPADPGQDSTAGGEGAPADSGAESGGGGEGTPSAPADDPAAICSA